METESKPDPRRVLVAAAVGIALLLVLGIVAWQMSSSATEDANQRPSAAGSTLPNEPTPDPTAPPGEAGGSDPEITTTTAPPPDTAPAGSGDAPTTTQYPGNDDRYEGPYVTYATPEPEPGCATGASEIVTVTWNGTAPSPSCVSVTSGQQLSVRNSTDAEVAVRFGGANATLAAADEQLLGSVGSLAGANGVHYVWFVGHPDAVSIVNITD